MLQNLRIMKNMSKPNKLRFSLYISICRIENIMLGTPTT
uniref:Uncharacterized protein n=1 Tax=Setaria italica TaxID=4555 RepID=K3ZPA0_SETIT